MQYDVGDGGSVGLAGLGAECAGELDHALQRAAGDLSCLLITDVSVGKRQQESCGSEDEEPCCFHFDLLEEEVFWGMMFYSRVSSTRRLRARPSSVSLESDRKGGQDGRCR